MKKMLAALLAMAMLLCAGSAMAEECDGWTALNSTQDLEYNEKDENYKLEAGSYCLSADLSGISLAIPFGAEVTLCLHGHGLAGIDIGSNADAYKEPKASLTLMDCTESGRVGEVWNFGTFIMDDGSVGYVCNREHGTFTMNGGEASGSGTENGVDNYGTFTMNGGKVTGSGASGGMDNDGMFIMYGGRVEGSGASNGVDNRGTFLMYGGTVSEAATEADSFYLTPCGVNNTDKFAMFGGTIEATGYAAGVNNSGNSSIFSMSGNAEISAQSGTGVYNRGGRYSISSGTVRGNTGVDNSGTFSMSGGTVGTTEDGMIGVNNSGEFTMSGNAKVSATAADDYIALGVGNSGEFTMSDNAEVSATNNTGTARGVDNSGEFTMSGNAEVSATGMSGTGVSGGTFTMHGGTVKGVNIGVDAGGPFSISVGTIKTEKGKAVGKATAGKSILPGSHIVSGGFTEASVVVAKILPAADLPQTGDASMLGAWAMLLAASGAGLMLRRKK